MIKNIWDTVEFVCLEHDPPVPLYVYEYSVTPFYACPKYMLKDEAHPNGHEKDEKACANRISFNDAMKIVEKMSAEIEAMGIGGFNSDHTGMRIKYKTIDAEVLLFTDEKVVIGVINRKRIGSAVHM